MGLDFGLSLGKKVNHNATVDPQTAKKAADGDSRTRAFTTSKCAPGQAGGGEGRGRWGGLGGAVSCAARRLRCAPRVVPAAFAARHKALTRRPLAPHCPHRLPGRGFIVDVSLKGTSLEHDVDDMEAAYGEGTTPADVLGGVVRPPKQAQLLYNALAAVEARVGA